MRTKAAAAGCAQPGLPELESLLNRRKGTGLMGGARLSAGVGEGVPTGPGWGKFWAGAGWFSGPRE